MAAPFAAPALAPVWRLKPKPVTGEQFGGVGGTAANPLTQADKFRRKGGELCSWLFILLAQHLNLKLMQVEGLDSHANRSASEIP